MEVFVCIGSSCHLKGSYDVIKLMKENIAAHRLEDTVHLNASFCLGHCTSGVTIKVNDEIVTGVCATNFNEIFSKYVLERCVIDGSHPAAQEIKL